MQLYDREALVKLVNSASRNGVLEKGGVIVGDVMKNIMAQPVDYEKFFTKMGSKASTIDMSKTGRWMKIGSKVVDIMNPFIRVASSDLVMKPISRTLDVPIVQRTIVNTTSKIGLKILA